MEHPARPVNVYDPAPRPRIEMCDLTQSEARAFWYIIFNTYGSSGPEFTNIRVQSHFLYRNGA